jgi:hypothetical protein
MLVRSLFESGQIYRSEDDGTHSVSGQTSHTKVAMILREITVTLGPNGSQHAMAAMAQFCQQQSVISCHFHGGKSAYIEELLEIYIFLVYFPYFDKKKVCL